MEKAENKGEIKIVYVKEKEDFSGLMKFSKPKLFIMKTSIQILFSFLFIIFISSCNNKDSKKEKSNDVVDMQTVGVEDLDPKFLAFDDVCNAAGIANVAIRRTLADSMMKHFKDIFIKPSEKINIVKDSFWVEACTIKAVAEYMDTAKDITGLRIVFAAEKVNSQNVMKIFFVTTQQYVADKNRKDDKWDNSIPNLESCNDYKKYFSKFRDAVEQIKLFDSAFRENKVPTSSYAIKDSLSKKVWIDECVIKALAKFMKAAPTVDGINIKLGAYFSKDTSFHNNQMYNNQSSVILVPTTKKLDDWTIVEKIYKRVMNKRFDQALNHGSLCPQDCN